MSASFFSHIQNTTPKFIAFCDVFGLIRSMLSVRRPVNCMMQTGHKINQNGAVCLVPRKLGEFPMDYATCKLQKEEAVGFLIRVEWKSGDGILS